VVWGLPLAAVVVAAGVWLHDAERREMLAGRLADFRRQVEERPEFMVQVLAVDGASDPLAAAIREALGLRLPVSSFELDLEALRQTVAAFDPVARAQVHVRPGGVLQVEVEERAPAIIQRQPEGLVLLDAGGHRVGPLDDRGERADLPLIAGAGAGAQVPEALALVRAAEPLAERLAGFVRVGERRWDVVLAGGQRILLPEAGAVGALDQAMALDGAQDLLARDVTVVDLRNPRRPTLRMSEAAAQQVQETGAGAKTR
jgi:cell division protein FtsQ